MYWTDWTAHSYTCAPCCTRCNFYVDISGSFEISSQSKVCIFSFFRPRLAIRSFSKLVTYSCFAPFFFCPTLFVFSVVFSAKSASRGTSKRSRSMTNLGELGRKSMNLPRHTTTGPGSRPRAPTARAPVSFFRKICFFRG